MPSANARTAYPAAVTETRKQRVDRELNEMLQEIRVALPGVQVLFAFLLILPFQAGFSAITELERYVYFGTLLCAAAATALLIAPSSYHRLRFRAGVAAKEQMVLTSNRLLIAGTALLAVSMGAVVFLIADVMFGGAVGLIAAILTGLWFAWFWYLQPLRTPRDPDPAPEAEADAATDGSAGARR
jgi:hypothetical protein